MGWPFENNTALIVKKLAARSSQSEKRRNIMVITAILLASFLISFAGAAAVSFLQMQNNQVRDTYEAVYSHITEQDFQKLEALPETARAGEYYLMGTEESEQGYMCSFIYADKAMMYIGRDQMKLKSGHLPEKENELAVSESWLNEYAPDIHAGDEISLHTASLQGTYKVSGIMEIVGSEETEIHIFIVSKELLKNWPDYDKSDYRAYLHFDASLEMTEKEMKDYYNRAAEMLQLSAPSFNTQYFRWAFGRVDAGSFLTILLLAGLVLVGGGVVIQSIFRISVTEKIQYFGQLRSIGATRKQINRIVKKEGTRLGVLGISGGTFLGVVMAVIFMPNGFSLPGYLAVAVVTLLVCWTMIYVSMRKPVKIAERVSPVEAIRFIGGESKVVRRKKAVKKLSPYFLGLINFRRDRKKVISILASLSLGGILLLIVSSMLFTYSPKRMARHDFPNGDYKLYINSDRDLGDILRSGNPLNKELREEILSIEGVKDVIVDRQAVYGVFEKGENNGGGMCDMITEENAPDLEEILVEGSMPADGRSILLTDTYLDYFKGKAKTGTVIQMTIGESSMPLTVSGFFDAHKCRQGVGHGGLQLDGAMMFLPEEAFHEFMPGVENFEYSWEIVADPQKEENIGSKLQDLTASYADIDVDTFTDTVAYCKRAYSTPFHILQGLALMITLFGIINLINTTLSNQISRRHETTILRSVGLTKKQLYRMLTFEGICYVFFSILLTLLVGLPAAVIVHNQISMLVYNTHIPYTFPFLYMGLYGLTLFVLEFILSVWTIWKQGKYSLVEQLSDRNISDS